jgi:hypothetical protein
LPTAVVLDLGSRVRQAHAAYLAIHEHIFHHQIVRSLSFTHAERTHADALSALRTELDAAMAACQAVAGSSATPVEVTYLSELRSFASALHDTVTRLLSLCDVFAERQPRASEIARYRISVERQVARELQFTQAEARLREQVGVTRMAPGRSE